MKTTSHLSLFAFAALVIGSVPLLAQTNASAGNQPARVIAKVAPKYPYPHERNTEAPEGTVEVSFVIGDDGSVWNPQITRSSNGALNKPVLEALQKWKFQPALRGGRPAAIRAEQEFVFKLEDDQPAPVRLAKAN